MKSCIVHLLVFIILLGLFSLSFGTDANQLAGNKPQAVETYEKAYERALEITGFDKSKDYTNPKRVSDICELITTKDSTTAYVADEISNRIAWQVKLQNISLHLKGNTPEGAILGPVDFIILIDSLTGIPLRINSIPKEPIEREATSLEAEQQLGREYVGLPGELPVFSIFEIFNECKFYPAISKEIIINYVLYSKNDSPPKPVWIVYLRGLPPFHSGMNPNEEYKTTNRRYIIDANAGYVIWCDNLPIPRLC